MSNMEAFKEDLALLVEGGLIAIKQGDEEGAKKLFKAVAVLDAKNTAPKVGLGLIALHKMELETARKHFEAVLAVESTNWRAQVFLAFAFMLTVLQKGHPEERINSLQRASALAQEVLEKSDVESTKALARSLLEWERELKMKVTTVHEQLKN